MEMNPLTPMNHARAAHSMVLVKDDLIVIGGLGSDCSMLASCERYRVNEDMWEDLPDLNVPVMNPSVCVFNDNCLYKFGGKKSEEQLANTIERLHLEGGNWEVIQFDQRQVPRLPSSSCCFQVDSGSMIFFGGTFTTYADKCDQIWLLRVKSKGVSLDVVDDLLPVPEGFWMQQAVGVNNSGSFA